MLEERDESELLENDEDFSLFVSEDKSIWFIGLLAPLFILILFMFFHLRFHSGAEAFLSSPICRPRPTIIRLPFKSCKLYVGTVLYVIKKSVMNRTYCLRDEDFSR